MTRTIENVIQVRASTEIVWSVLTDTAAYPSWNPYYREVVGDLRVGSRLTVRASLNDRSNEVTSRPHVVDVRPGAVLAWRNRAGLPGVLDSQQTFRIVSDRAGVVEVRQHEVFSGLLVRPLKATLDDIELRCQQVLAAIKERAEEASAVR